MMEAVMPKTQAATLSDSQLVILSAAAQLAEGSLLPFPQSLTAKGTRCTKSSGPCNRKLAKRGGPSMAHLNGVGKMTVPWRVHHQ
jgi:hypothetical protein